MKLLTRPYGGNHRDIDGHCLRWSTGYTAIAVSDQQSLTQRRKFLQQIKEYQKEHPSKRPKVAFLNEMFMRDPQGNWILRDIKGKIRRDEIMPLVDEYRPYSESLWISDNMIHQDRKWKQIIDFALDHGFQGIAPNLHIGLDPSTPKGVLRIAAWKAHELGMVGMMDKLGELADRVYAAGLRFGVAELSVFGLGNDSLYRDILSLLLGKGSEFVTFWNPSTEVWTSATNPEDNYYPWHWDSDKDPSDSCLFGSDGKFRFQQWELADFANGF